MPPDTQTGFSAALLDPTAPVPPNVVDPSGRIAPKRFAVYRNNVTVALTEAVKAGFPAVLALVGEAFFIEMARQFVRQTPPQSPVMAEYGRAFPEFIAGFVPAAGLPFLADVARLDRAWLDAYHAADADPLDATSLAARDEDALLATRLTACPSLRIVSSSFPLVTIWQAARAGQVPAFDGAPQAETALVTRRDVTIEVTCVGPAVGSFLASLADGQALGDAAEVALAADETFDFTAALFLVLTSSGFAAIA